MTRPGRPILFIHGLWKSSAIWDRWIDYFSLENYRAQAILWPGERSTAEATRHSAPEISPYTFEDVMRRVEDTIAGLDEPPICIGHSFGALIAERLLASGAATAAVAIDPAQPGSVFPGSIERLRTVPLDVSDDNLQRQLIMLPADLFQNSFTDELTDVESRELYEKYAIPGSAKMLLEVAAPDFRLIPETTLGTTGPLLLLPSTQPPSAFLTTQDPTILAFRDSTSVEVNEDFIGRGHALVFDRNWESVADVVINWLERKGL